MEGNPMRQGYVRQFNMRWRREERILIQVNAQSQQSQKKDVGTNEFCRFLMNPVSWDEYETIDIKDDAIRNKYHQMLEILVPIEYIVTILKYQWYGENEQPTDDVDEYFEFFLRDNRYFFHK